MAKFIITNPNLDVSSDEERYDDFIMYKDRPEWSDVKPVPQDDGPYSVVSIRYSPQFEDTFNYFRAILLSNEVSDRALELTGDCIKFNASNYTLWHYRRFLLEKLNKSFLGELKLIERVILKNQKNYQVWEHYKYILKKLKEKILLNEMENMTVNQLAQNVKTFIRSVLTADSKNYHAWQHLQWLIRDWEQWDNEIDYVEKLIDDDIRNNSAWNHRFYVIQNTTGFTEEVIESELVYTLKLVKLASHNESAWNYLLGVLKKSNKTIDSFPSVIVTCEQLYSEPSTRSSHLMSFMVSYFIRILQNLCQKGMSIKDEEFNKTYLRCCQFCEELANSVDTIRQEYWKYRADQIKEKYSTIV